MIGLLIVAVILAVMALAVPVRRRWRARQDARALQRSVDEAVRRRARDGEVREGVGLGAVLQGKQGREVRDAR